MLRMVTVEHGQVQGLPAADPRITSFKGIPFAAPPVGENRWRAPQPQSNWEGVLQAFDFAPISMQAPTVIDDNNIYTREWAVDPDLPMDEDCLYLNVWTPAKHTDEKLPVFVWYFGGGLQVGHTAEMEFDGERIARRGIVVVTINYRLNAFGFLCHPEISAESPHAPANFGHLDQQAGTQWVKRNIAAFGGDPDQITIGGQSAGGGSVLSQMTSPQNKGLFQRAVIMSGIATELYPKVRVPSVRSTLRDAEQAGVEFFGFLGVSSLAEARQLDAEYLRDKALEYKSFWGTVIDEQFCAGDPFTRFVQQEREAIPVMLGHTSSEFWTRPAAANLEELKQMAVELFGEDAPPFLQLCEADTGQIEHALQQASVRMIQHAILLAIRANSGHPSETPLYYYNFDAEIPGWDQPGTFHSVDLWFFFETLAKCWRPFTGKHYDLARQMCNYLSNFIATGDPNGSDSTGKLMPHWTPCTTEQPYLMEFGDQAQLQKAEPGPMLAFLIEQYFKKQNEPVV
ncbi:para-nitrobenzyl esterase [Paenibacillus sp. W4I10]|uniref:carboxylesterase/lipase family protein n=1 Tax=Paenibacillus sp. W4I10 TaxID=3042298 RepID=UPI00277EA2F7|nr:carboxylesterase family protein [Paenibacillus sp. W4I10]MDQ0722699.1 para-nitrobenzyl esterase [Paenibacillus sp. W4I10]